MDAGLGQIPLPLPALGEPAPAAKRLALHVPLSAEELARVQALATDRGISVPDLVKSWIAAGSGCLCLVARPAPPPPTLKKIRKLIAEAELPQLEAAVRGMKDVEIDLAKLVTGALNRLGELRQAAKVARGAPGPTKTKGGRRA